jgi:hypothetical protein
LARVWAAGGKAHAGGNSQDPPGIGDNILLPRARDSDPDDALPDGQTVCAATEFVEHTDGFDSGYGRELRGEFLSVADGMQVAGTTATTFRLQVAALDRAGQTVREQLGEPCRILKCAAFSEKCCAV